MCVCGLPASGKSYFSTNLKKELSSIKTLPQVKITDPDIIRNSLGEEIFDPNKENWVRAESLRLVKEYLEKGFIVIDDDLNYYSSMRHDLKQIADEVDVKFFIIHISTPLKTCVKWNEMRGFTIPNEVIYDVAEKFDDFRNYKWDTPFRTYDLSKIANLSLKVKDLSERLIRESRKEKKLEAPVFSTSNLEHEKLDQLTRNIVNEILQLEEFRLYKKTILKFRKKFMKKYLKIHEEEIDLREEFKRQLEEILKEYGLNK